MVQPHNREIVSGRTASDAGCPARDLQVHYEERGASIMLLAGVKNRIEVLYL
jgi:hypothetical protein